MLVRLKQYLMIAVIVGAFYYLLDHHIIFSDFTNIDVLKKETLTLKYTFFSLKQSRPEHVLKIPELREAGIGKIFINKGIISEQEYQKILSKIERD